MEVLFFILALIFGTGLGFGTAFLVCASMLKKSNDIGDSVGEAKEYSSGAVFTVSTKRLKKAERESFVRLNEIPLKSQYEEPADTEEVHKLEKIG